MADNKILFSLENLRRRGKATAHKAYDVIKGTSKKNADDYKGKQTDFSEAPDSLDKIKKELKVIDVWQPGVPPRTINDEKMNKMRDILGEDGIKTYKTDKESYFKELRDKIQHLYTEFKDESGPTVGGLIEQEKTLREKIEFANYIPDLRKERKELEKQKNISETEKGNLGKLKERLASIGDDKETSDRIDKLIKRRESRIEKRKDLIKEIDEATQNLFVEEESQTDIE